MIFISHDSRDAELAEAFAKLLSSVSCGMLKSFRSSDKKGSQGIEYGLEWYSELMGKLGDSNAVVRLNDDSLWLSLLELFTAIGYVILVPYLGIRWVQTRNARFIRCPHCGDWFGQDARGANSGLNPKVKGIIDTGRCSKCGAPILSDPESTA